MTIETKNLGVVQYGKVSQIFYDINSRYKNLVISQGQQTSLDESLKVWKDNETEALKFLGDYKTVLTALYGSEKDPTKKAGLKKDVDSINKLLAEVSGLGKRKTQLEQEIQNILTKYTNASFKFEDEYNKIGKDKSHWSAPERGNDTWKVFLSKIAEDGGDADKGLDGVKSGLFFALGQTLIPELVKRFKAGTFAKKDILDIISKAEFQGYAKSVDASVHVSDTVLVAVNALVPPKKKVADWNVVLGELNTFFTTDNPTTLKEIKDFLDNENYPDPLDGVDLNGQTAADLRTKLKGNEEKAVEAELPKAKDYAAKYQNYIPFQSSRDGNCFLNSFSILLNGDEALVAQLRAKLCLELMAGKWVDGVEADKVKEIAEKLTTRNIDGQACALTIPGNWLAGDDIAYMCGIIDRPITLIYRPDITTWDTAKDAYKEVDKTGGFAVVEYPMKGKNPFGKPSITGMSTTKAPEYVIYHVNGNHFVPLVTKT